jgi:hypothetical protein
MALAPDRRGTVRGAKIARYLTKIKKIDPIFRGPGAFQQRAFHPETRATVPGELFLVGDPGELCAV